MDHTEQSIANRRFQLLKEAETNLTEERTVADELFHLVRGRTDAGLFFPELDLGKQDASHSVRKVG